MSSGLETLQSDDNGARGRLSSVVERLLLGGASILGSVTHLLNAFDCLLTNGHLVFDRGLMTLALRVDLFVCSSVREADAETASAER